MPLNSVTEKIFYNQRIIIDNNINTEPRTWIVSKVNRLSNNGLVLVTLAQDMFDAHTDYIEYNDNGDIVGKWADYYKDNILPTNLPLPCSDIHCDITYPGKPNLKLGGNYKTFTVTFYDDTEVIDFINGDWIFTYKDGASAEDVLDIVFSDDNKVKVKFIGDSNYIGTVLSIGFKSNDGISSFVDVEVTGL